MCNQGEEAGGDHGNKKLHDRVTHIQCFSLHQLLGSGRVWT